MSYDELMRIMEAAEESGQLAAYLEAGKPFGATVVGMVLWVRYEQQTTVN